VPAPPNLNQNWTPNRAQVAITNSLLANQTDVRAHFVTGPFDHTVATGLDLIRETRDFLRNGFAGQAATNFLDPNPWRLGGLPIAPTASQLTSGTSENVGVYIADQIKFTRYFELLGAVRYDQFRFVQDAPLAVPSVAHLDHTDKITSWRVGAVLHPWEDSSLYFMRGTSFNPTADGLTISVATPATALSTIALGPEETNISEIGFKADLLNKRLSIATAIFDTEKTNLRVPDPVNASVQVLAGVVRVLGFEASVTGYLTDKWQMIASYSHLNAKITKTTVAAQLYNEPQITPEHAFSLWSTYDVTPELQLGGGAFYTSTMWADLPNTAIVPSFWRFDAMAAYKLSKDATLQLNVYNVFDRYYAASAYTNWIVPGASRTAALTLRTRF
jgi:catecholate siderophore receptor